MGESNDRVPAVEPHLHWRFMAWNGEQDAERIKFGVSVEFVGYESEEGAKIAAGAVVKRENYVLMSVLECRQCEMQRRTLDTLREVLK